METFIESAKERRTILCFGVDPDMARISAALGKDVSVEEAIAPYFHSIIEKLLDENEIAAIKPNYAYFAQYWFEGLYALEDIMKKYRNRIPIIIDAKRGDIGKSSQAYAKEAYDFWGADAVTISPYMGYDSVSPFLREGKLAYMLCKTSNKGSSDFQELECAGRPVYDYVAQKAVEWKCGIVVGATDESIKNVVRRTEGEVPMLIPGIGKQGGDLSMVMDAIKENPHLHRINASSSIAYAFEKRGRKPADAALEEARALNEVIRRYV